MWLVCLLGQLYIKKDQIMTKLNCWEELSVMCKVFSRGFLPWFSLSSAGDGDAGSQKLGWTYIPKLGPPLLTPFGETKKNTAYQPIRAESNWEKRQDQWQQGLNSHNDPTMLRQCWGTFNYFIVTMVGSRSLPRPVLSTLLHRRTALGSKTVDNRNKSILCLQMYIEFVYRY